MANDGESSSGSTDTEGKKKLRDILLRKKKLKNVFIRFSERTTLQGFGFISSSKRGIAKIFWIIIVIAALVAMVIHVKNVFNDFYSYPKKTSVSLGYGTFPLPAITICNINILKQSKIDQMPNGKKLVAFLKRISFQAEHTKEEYERLEKVKKSNTTSPDNWDNGDDDYGDDDYGDDGYGDDGYGDDNESIDSSMFEPDETDYFFDEMYKFYDESNRLLDSGYLTEQLFKSLYVNIPRSERRDAGHHMKDMLINCTYGGETCSADNFTLYQSAEHGNCWTFTSPKSVGDSGSQAGLQLVMFMENYEFINRLTLGYGARIVIHPQDSMPIPKEEGFHVSSGFATDIALRKVEISRLPEPYGDCKNIYAFKKHFGVKYTRQACLRLCRNSRHINECGCFSVEDEDIFLFLKNVSFNKCSTKEELTCSLSHRETIHGLMEDCKCTNPCEETQYEKHISHLDWPSDFYVAVLETYARQKWNRTRGLFKDLDPHIRSKNFLKLNIYYEDLNFNAIEEEPEYTTAGFMSDLGGATGLWIGLSLMSLFELVQLLADIIDFVINRAMRMSEKGATKKRLRRSQKGNGGNRRTPNRFGWFKNVSPFSKRGKNARVTTSDAPEPAEFNTFEPNKHDETHIP